MNIAGIIRDYLLNDEVEEKVIKALNDAVDIPFINEKTEEKIARAVWSAVADVLDKVLAGK